jgi:hypothetical protein
MINSIDFINENTQEDSGSFESIKTIYNNFIHWWTVNFPILKKLPDVKELQSIN